MIRTLLVDDHPVVRQGIKKIIERTSDIVAVSEASNGDEAIRRVSENGYDVVVLDINMPGRSGLDIMKEIKSINPRLPILVLTMYAEKQLAVQMLRLGVSGYLTKDKAPGELVDAIRKVSQGHKYISPTLAEGLAAMLEYDTTSQPHMALSKREFEVMIMLASGKSMKMVAEELYISLKTVRAHKLSILSRMNMSETTELTIYAVRNGLIDL